MADFTDLTKRFCQAACTGGAELAVLFSEDGTYHDGFYGEFIGRTGTRVVFTGMGRFRLEDGLITHYTEIFDPGIGMAQLGFDAERIARRAQRSAQALRSEPEMAAFLAGAPVAMGE
jgi:hypothetical protein